MEKKFEIAEKVVVAALTRTGLLTIRKNSENGTDFIATGKDNPNNILHIEIKASKESKSELELRYTKYLSDLERTSGEKAYIVFFINPDDQTGFFRVVSTRNNARDLKVLRMDYLSNELSSYFGRISGIEFPPYTFYQRPDGSKYSTEAIPVDEKFHFLRLFNLSLIPMDINSGIKVVVTVGIGLNKQVYEFHSNALFYNPNLKHFLFFVNGNIEYTDIPLPAGRKHVTIKIDNPKNNDFEMKLACNYLSGNSEKQNTWA